MKTATTDSRVYFFLAGFFELGPDFFPVFFFPPFELGPDFLVAMSLILSTESVSHQYHVTESKTSGG
jgi:hypothetical protein